MFITLVGRHTWWRDDELALAAACGIELSTYRRVQRAGKYSGGGTL